MKNILIIAVAGSMVLSACNNASTNDADAADSTGVPVTKDRTLTDTVPAVPNHSSSEFSKSSSSPAGSTGATDSAVVKSSDSMQLKKVNDKKAARDSVKR